MDQVARTIQEPVFGIGEIARDLAHPCSIGSGMNPRDLDSAGLEVDDKEDEKPNQAGPGDHFDAEEVRRRDRPPMRPQEPLPRQSLLPDGIESVFEKNSFDRVSTDLVSQVVERSSDSRIAPARVVAGHPDDQLLDFDRGLRTSRPSALAAIVLPVDQLSLPSKHTVWRPQGVAPAKPSAPDCFAPYP